MSVLDSADLNYYDDLYKTAPVNMTRENKADALELFESDFDHIITDLGELAKKNFGITAENISGQHILKFRRLNKLLSEAYGVAEELIGESKKQNEKKAIK